MLSCCFSCFHRHRDEHQASHYFTQGGWRGHGGPLLPLLPPLNSLTSPGRTPALAAAAAWTVPARARACTRGGRAQNARHACMHAWRRACPHSRNRCTTSLSHALHATSAWLAAKRKANGGGAWACVVAVRACVRVHVYACVQGLTSPPSRTHTALNHPRDIAAHAWFTTHLLHQLALINLATHAAHTSAARPEVHGTGCNTGSCNVLDQVQILRILLEQFGVEQGWGSISFPRRS